MAMYMTFTSLRAWPKGGGMVLLLAVNKFACHFLDSTFHHLNISIFVDCFKMYKQHNPVMDVSARTTMKSAAKYEKHCELQDSVNQERELNAYCIFGLFLKSCLLQCLLFLCGACHSSFTFSCFHVSMKLWLHTHMCLGGA